MLACVVIETDQLQNKFQNEVISHVYCRKAQTQIFAMLPLQYGISEYSNFLIKT